MLYVIYYIKYIIRTRMGLTLNVVENSCVIANQWNIIIISTMIVINGCIYNWKNIERMKLTSKWLRFKCVGDIMFDDRLYTEYNIILLYNLYYFVSPISHAALTFYQYRRTKRHYLGNTSHSNPQFNRVDMFNIMLLTIDKCTINVDF